MNAAIVPVEIADQVAAACAVIERHPGTAPQAIHLFGSALDGGLKPRSDIDLPATVDPSPDETVRRASDRCPRLRRGATQSHR